MEPHLKYRWVILALAWLLFGTLFLFWYNMPTIAPRIMEMYSIDQTMYSLVFTLPWLLAGLLAFPAGIFADRVGVRTAATVGGFIAALGTFVRTLPGVEMLLLSQALLGFGVGMVLVNLPKAINAWFPPQQVGLATGIYLTSMMIFISVGMVIAPYFPSWESMNLTGAIVILIATLLFAAFVKNAPPGTVIPKPPVIEGAKVALSSKAIWGAALGTFVAMMGMVPWQALFATAAFIEKGIPLAIGGAIVSLITNPGWVGSFVFPMMSSKTGKVRVYIAGLSIAFSALMLAAWFNSNLNMLWVLVGLAGFVAGGVIPHWMAVPAYLPFVENKMKPEYIGGASGVLNTFLCIGAFISTPFIIAPIASASGFTIAFIVASIFFAIQGLFAILIPEPPKA
ncbi:MAG: MFS transporter [Archaeoglobaceae archaeon]